MTRTVEVRRGLYRDSVALMQMSHTVAGLPGVESALIAMATPLNLDLLPGLGFEPEAGTSPDDLLVAISADDDDALASALRRLEELFSARESEGAAEVVPPRTTQSALKRSGAHLAVISVPGPNAFVEAMDTLRQDADVMLFSDNVSVEQEIRLKDEAHERGLLVMGPDCGTAIVGGVGLGFANVMQPGRVGIVAASGTGAQQVCALLDAAGVGVSAVLGTGGRDLSSAVEARATLDAMNILDAHDGTDLIIVLSKPPPQEVAERVQAAAEQLQTPIRRGLPRTGPGRSDHADREGARGAGMSPARRSAVVCRAIADAARRCSARPLLRGHAVRRGDGHRRGGARADPIEHSTRARMGARARPSLRRSSDDRLRR